ncbi:MAG: isopentenyl-diphosphate Delta-isomerase [Bacteroidetes bacterium]|nr:isopentenyl-diphosphate Delta-isomerase [Bacteroidota bacterium]
MSSTIDHVVLVDENDRFLGTMEKLEAHEKGLLHRAFSIFVFNDKNELLLQKRALSKYHSGGLWTNTCCSHQRFSESTLKAAHRRLKEEMGFDCYLEKSFSFVYQTEFNNGLKENEFDHVLIGYFDGEIAMNSNEVCEYKYLSLCEIQKDLEENPQLYTFWFKIAFEKIYQQLKYNAEKKLIA